MRALLLTGHGRYADPWHPFEETSRRIAAILAAASIDLTEFEDVDAGLATLGDDRSIDLLVVNAGDPWRSDVPDIVDPSPRNDGLVSALARGVGVLAFHASASTLRDVPDWAGVLGAVWLPGLSMHPPLDETTISIVDRQHPVAAGRTDFRIVDERYCRLQRTGPSHIIATHVGTGRPEPALWTRRHGASRIVYDALGHDARSFDSASHRAIIAAASHWAANGRSE